jgi:hypothetical protein
MNGPMLGFPATVSTFYLVGSIVTSSSDNGPPSAVRGGYNYGEWRIRDGEHARSPGMARIEFG